jgi:hypothetical protein
LLRFHPKRLLFLFPALALGITGACSVDFAATTSSPSEGPFRFNSDGGLQPADAIAPLPDDAVTADAGYVPQKFRGSPLCNASAVLGCFPDDPSTCTPDAGVGVGIAPDSGVLTCQVGWDNTANAPSATCAIAGTGGDGAPCTHASDCAPAFACVGTVGVPGQCRHYCCAGADSCAYANGGASSMFCDVQPTAEANNTIVPVCMPVQSCKLLQDGCPTGTTCAVVGTDGTTSCVQTGNGKAGDPCNTADVEHCADNLVCLGAGGSGQCYQLCHTANPVECSSTEKCMTGGPLFPDPSIGICQTH